MARGNQQTKCWRSLHLCTPLCIRCSTGAAGVHSRGAPRGLICPEGGGGALSHGQVTSNK
eukprot:588626-Prorocentrum_minimum.AAC.1